MFFWGGGQEDSFLNSCLSLVFVCPELWANTNKVHLSFLPSLRNSCIKHDGVRGNKVAFPLTFPATLPAVFESPNCRIHKDELQSALTYLPSPFSFFFLLVCVPAFCLNFPHFGRAGFMLMPDTCWEVSPPDIPHLSCRCQPPTGSVLV